MRPPIYIEGVLVTDEQIQDYREHGIEVRRGPNGVRLVPVGNNWSPRTITGLFDEKTHELLGVILDKPAADSAQERQIRLILWKETS